MMIFCRNCSAGGRSAAAAALSVPCLVRPGILSAAGRLGANDRVHVGLESGCDEVLALMAKGATREEHIAAGRRAKAVGFSLSEYVMPGLGGRRAFGFDGGQAIDGERLLLRVGLPCNLLRRFGRRVVFRLGGFLGSLRLYRCGGLRLRLRVGLFRRRFGGFGRIVPAGGRRRRDGALGASRVLGRRWRRLPRDGRST